MGRLGISPPEAGERTPAFLPAAGIERHDEPPLIARVLARADDDWTEGWLLEVVTGFVERRVRAGERPTAAEFEHTVNASDEQLVAGAVAALAGALPAETVRDFEQWRERRARLEFFRSFGRIWAPLPDTSALTTVGGRMAVVEELRAVFAGRALVPLSSSASTESASPR